MRFCNHGILGILPPRTRDKHGVLGRGAGCGHCAGKSPQKQTQAMQQGPRDSATGLDCNLTTYRHIVRDRLQRKDLRTEEGQQAAASLSKRTAGCPALKRWLLREQVLFAPARRFTISKKFVDE